MVRPGLVIFDCDGVLVDSEYLDNVATVAYLAELGLTIGLEESERLFTGLSNAAIAEAVEARLGSPVPPTFAADLAATIYEKLAASGLRAIPGALHSVRAVANAGIPICVASNGEVAKMEMTLAKTGLIEHFSGAMSG
jgi:beta-phosphoglucomutase-like phosphatase (HAD superfamily)